MRRLILASLCLALLGAPGPARADEPAYPKSYEYYGPLRICDQSFAFDVLKSEGYVREGISSFPHLIFFMDGYLTIGGAWVWHSEPDSRTVHALGEIELSGQRLRRFELNPPNGQPTEFFYVYVWGPESKTFTIMSNRFDGSDRDRAMLERIAFGDRARDMCASVPIDLRRGPERERPDAYFVAPATITGPATICLAGLVFALKRGESVALPWLRSWNYFQIVAGDRRTGVSGLDERVWKRTGEPDVKGPVSLDPRFVTGEVPYLPESKLGGSFVPGPNRRVVALWRRADGESRPPNGLSPVGFTFDRATGAEERQAFIQRLRTQVPTDRCVASDPS